MESTTDQLNQMIAKWRLKHQQLLSEYNDDSSRISGFPFYGQALRNQMKNILQIIEELESLGENMTNETKELSQ